MTRYIPLEEKDLPERYEPDWESLESATSEEPFMEAAFHLAKECGILATIIASVKPKEPVTLHQAIDLGMVVRLSKLMKIIVRDASNREPYQQLVTSRQLLETGGTLVYLLNDDGSGSRYMEYIQDSLVAEKMMLEEVQRNIKARGGVIWEIEKRMERSIRDTARAAGIDSIESIPGRGSIGFPSFEDRVKMIGAVAYVGYRAGSAEVHGTWTDLYKYHLISEDDTFYPNTDEPQLRPQVTTTAISVVGRVLRAYISSLEPNMIPEEIDSRLEVIIEQDQRLVDLHETYLAK